MRPDHTKNRQLLLDPHRNGDYKDRIHASTGGEGGIFCILKRKTVR
jgi:hypothetical protein